MAIIDKLDYLNETKRQIRESLNDLGAEINQNDTFRSYVTKIDELYSEYPQIQTLSVTEEATSQEGQEE